MWQKREFAEMCGAGSNRGGQKRGYDDGAKTSSAARTYVCFDQLRCNHVLAHESSCDATAHKLVSNEVLHEGEDISAQIRERYKALRQGVLVCFISPIEEILDDTRMEIAHMMCRTDRKRSS